MYIKEITIDNFKSFADKTMIPFLEGFTTVSGPNGSGKSNIIDSILFALGLSTSRTLRAEKLPDLINNRSKRKEASVKIVFQVMNDQNEADIISVTRRIKQSSSGYTGTYYFNDKVSTLGEVHEELAKHNISPGCYNVMMQGDVTNIINVTPFERRKILDEIAGVADFDRRIDQAKKELETVGERVDKSNIILNEIDIRLVQLEEERAHALKYQKLKEEKTELQGKLSVVKYSEIKTSIERLHESILDGDKTQKSEQQKLEEIKLSAVEIKEKLDEITAQIKDKGEDEQIEIKKQVEALKGVISRKKDSIAYIEKQVGDNIKSIASSGQNIENLKEKIEDANFKIDNKNDEITIIEKNLKKEKEELSRVLSEVSSINQTTNEHLEKRNSLRKDLDDLQSKENDLIKEKMIHEEKVSRFERDMKEAQDYIDNSNNINENNTEQKDLLETQLQELEQELKDFEIQQKNCLYDLDKIKGELNDLNYNITLAYRKVTQLEANKRAAEEANYGRAIDTVMNAGLPGIHAPLAQLGKVDKEYSTALEIAMGGRMKSIVTDNDKIASMAIEVLKSSRAGRATFLPLNKINSNFRNSRLPNVDGVIDFAINLIDFDDIYRTVFEFALGETLIVEDMEVARRLIGKYRMVTIDGSLVERTGAMTGGSVARSGLKFAQSDDEELDKFKARLNELEYKNQTLEKSKKDYEFKLDKNRQEYSSVMNDYNRKKIELENAQRNLKNAQSKLDEKKGLLENLQPKLEAEQVSLNESNEKAALLSDKVARLKQEIEIIENNLPKDELSKLNELTESIEFEIKSNESKLNNAHNDIKALKMEIDFNKEAITIQDDRVEQLKKDNIQLDQEKILNQKEIDRTNERLIELEAKIKELGAELVELQEERSKINEELLGKEKKKSSLENKIERLKEQIEAFKQRRKDLEPELAAIREELKQQGYDIANIAKIEISVDDITRNINRLQKKMELMEPVNMKALSDYEEVESRKVELKEKIDTLSTEADQIRERMGSYEDMKKQSFLDTYNNVNTNFIEIFAQLSDGQGKIILENMENPFEGGLTIEAEPRGKKTQRLEAMSGGEKSLTALAFVFALQRYMPAPFYAFDEVDMHLDGINAEKLSQMIRYQAMNTQFIVVSLRKPMIESADRTIGVTQKNNGVTKVTGVKLHG